MSVAALRERIRHVDPVLREGRVRKILPTYIEADGPHLPLGALCTVEARASSESSTFPAEVVRVDQNGIVLLPFEHGIPSFLGAKVTAWQETGNRMPVGEALLGRVVDALGRPLDSADPLAVRQTSPLQGTPPPPLERISTPEPLETGLRAIDGLLTLGKGQRIGIFAASGVGKTSLLRQLATQVEADIVILCLVGERGREVEAIWSGLSDKAKARTSLIAATSDQSAAMRVRAGHYALALAEYWRGQGRHVLLLLDSITRLAMAMREIGLAAGEPPTMRAYTPGVFAAIPRMVERCGALASGGAITAVMTVLSESDEIDDPICELMKSLLDGHFILSRALAERGHFPALDILRSISRQATEVMTPNHRHQAQQVLEWMSLYESSRTLIDTGLYSKGHNPALDRAIEKQPEITRFLQQLRDEKIALPEILAALTRLTGNGG